MNALTLLVTALLVYALAYRFYASFIIAKVLAFDPDRPTPAHTLENGYDYKPTNRWVLFGHHFAAIAGAGPLVGPVLAAQFGYLPGFLWILIGSVLAGGVHDMVILFASVRYNGLSLTEIARRETGKTAGWATTAAVLFIIITALAGLSMVVVNALAESSWGTFSIAMTIPIAVFVGWYMNKARPGKITEASVIGVTLVVAAIVLGEPLSRSGWAHYFLYSKTSLSIILAVYGMLASILPVWLLLTPRDYLSSYMKIGTIGLLALGILWVRPEIAAPAFTSFIHGGGPIIPGHVWPYVCITVACGAISGFHSLISSGTTPKMIASERDLRLIGYGAMLTEGFVSIMALIAATVLLPGDYFAINVPPEVFQKLGLSVSHLPDMAIAVGEHLEGRAGGAVSLAVGMAQIFTAMPGMKSLLSYWYHFAIMFEALFILTTIDAGTRVARYITQEVFGKVYAPFARTDWWPGVFLTSFLVCAAWGGMLMAGNISTIWPMFGVANQLLSAIALAVGTTFILKRTKAVYALVTFVPFLFMLATTVSAGIMNITGNYLPRHDFQGWLNVTLTAIMLALAAVITVESVKSWLTALGLRHTVTSKPVTGNQ
ncbi:MAG: carbon starvation protein CstA [Elusimicrobia bacterium GWF2_52_66]|nr:MAG: carbon starvation protein CstA [Elusimicrobia bacterium GWA2_51_34]OGR86390.1 MAG: carbon starvation protein CstA [Elusimicrobia bacterium GWF2_52_66]HAF96190.1 carbon starvation protein A [Elusimicrobiota bacterium]HCE97801.1 carbon starvation protein A [Elusimicrobiota bacterium]